MADQDSLISDRALAVFAFAAYHELESGQVVRSVARRDDAGHKADEAAVDELQKQGYIEADDDFIRFTSSGEQLKQSVIDALHKAVVA